MAGDTLNTIVPIILVIIAVIWVWSVFGDGIKRFYDWIKNLTTSNKDRFKPHAILQKEFTYS